MFDTLIVAGLVLGLVLVVILFVMGQFINLYIQARVSNASVTLLEMIGMRLRKVDIREVVLARIRSVGAELEIPTHELERHFLNGGRVQNVVAAVIAAKTAGLSLDWETAKAIDLEGRNVLAEVRTSVGPGGSRRPPRAGVRPSTGR